jgi:hypothetical protein
MEFSLHRVHVTTKFILHSMAKWQFVTDVATQPIGPIFKVNEYMKMGPTGYPERSVTLA